MKNLLFLTPLLLLVAFLMISCSSEESESDLGSYRIAAESSGITMDWELISNFEPENTFSATLTIHNQSDVTLSESGWSLFFNSIRPPIADSFLPELELEHINGDFFKLTPTDDFRTIAPGDSRKIEYSGRFFSIKASDAPQGFYFVFDDGLIKNVDSVNIEPFVRTEQKNRSEGDLVEVPAPESDFTKNEALSLLQPNQVSRVTPTPVSFEAGEGYYQLNGSHVIYHHESLSHEADMLADYLNAIGGVAASTRFLGMDTDPEGNVIILDMEISETANSEAYQLDISPGLIQITAADRPGIFYGIQTARALIEFENPDDIKIKAAKVEDEPAYGYRGMHLDVSRNFQPMSSVTQLLDIMAMYKMNKFHFHLTDDEGWRLEIEQLPELTEIGGRRGHTETEENYLIPSYGSGPDPTVGDSFGSGWYTRDQYIEILRFATDRHIEVIPEIDVPGHARAAIVAMKARAERLSRAGDEEAANYYRLDDVDDQSEYLSIQNFNDNVINVCTESTFRFLDLVIDEVIAMHQLAGAPLNTIHIGGDEVPAGVWQGSPACEAYMAEHDIDDTQGLQVHFFGKLRDMLADRDLQMAGWEEIAFMGEPHGEAKTPNPDYAGTMIPHIWSNIWGSGTEDYAYTLANMGYEIIMSHASNFYFDFAYNKHWEEPGFYWAAMFDTKEPYSFIPTDLYRNARTDSYGNPIAHDYFDDAIRLTDQGRENILGLQGQLWTETVNQPGRMDYMIYPRLLGLAERAWVGDAEWAVHENSDDMWAARDEAWNEFANRIGQIELSRLDALYSTINYRIPTPGVVVRNGEVLANSPFPGLDIRFTLDGEEPDLDSPLYEGPVNIGDSQTVKAAIFNSNGRKGRTVTVPITNN
ncbi:MAG: carbohydate-binding domain-containing protein [Balneolaceae bacterium]|nr:carbohydate-binding domain-containing protein [Balneolaceae bacterium]